MSDILQAKTITGEYSGFADSALRDVSGTFLTTVPDTYLQNTDLSTTDGKVTAISGIPLSAGGNVAVYTDAALPNSTQLDADIAAGKAICIVYDGRNYWFDRKSSDYYFYGADAYSTYLYYLFFRPGNNSWSRGQKILATQSWVTAEMSSYANSASVTGTAQYGLTTAGWSEITAGGDVPEGVMVESGLEYNAVNEISGYNGSAIAQYGAEKQWLVHDDTLVHASNSAQYALGVNLSAVAQLLGVDETVLWTGNIAPGDHTTSFTLSEPFSAFERIRFEGVQYGGATPTYEITTPTTNTYVGVGLQYYCFNNDSNPYQFRGASFSSTNGLTYSAYKEKFVYWTNTGLSPIGGSTTQGPNIRKIVGIGRKQ